MKPVFFVQNNFVQRVTIPVAEFAHKHGIALEDRSSYSGFDPHNCGIEWDQYGPVLSFGSVQFVRKLKADLLLSKHIQYSEEAFSTSYWVHRLQELAANHAGRLCIAGDVQSAIRNAGKLHVRPDCVDKAFTAALFDSDAWNRVKCERNVDDNLTCWASPALDIKGEWRCWFVGGDLVEISQYRKNGEPHRVVETSNHIWDDAQWLANHYLPVSTVVMDLAETNQGIQVLEYNPIHGSGWYAARVEIILTKYLEWAMERYT